MALTTTVLKTNALGRVTISKEHREALLDAFDQSGLKGLEFARHHDVNYQTFANWIQKRRRERGLYPVVKPAVNDTALKLTLAEVELPSNPAPPIAEKPASPAVEIALPSGLSIRLANTAAIPLAVQLVTALEASQPC
jgi:hypothetical protein